MPAPIQTLLSLLEEVKTWLLSGVAILTVIAVLKDFYIYQGGNDREKETAMMGIKKSLKMGVGIFIIIWIATYAIAKFK